MEEKNGEKMVEIRQRRKAGLSIFGGKSLEEQLPVIKTRFFQIGRDLGGSSHHHQYTKKEKELLSRYSSADYFPPHSQVYKHWLLKHARNLDWDRWLMMGIIGLCVGLVGFFMHQFIKLIAEARWDVAYLHVASGNHATALGWIALISILLALTSGALTVLFCFPAAGSGLPELIGYLNGTIIPEIFGLKTFFVKFASCVCAVGSGLPVGPEGPMISLGGLIGLGVSQGRSKFFGRFLPFGRFENPEDRRNFVSAGAGAGVAAAFGAPVGGLLFAMEEVASFWSIKHGWMTFFCCMTSTFITDLFNSAFSGFQYSGDFGQFKPRRYILFEVTREIPVNILAFLPAIIIGIIGGFLGALFTFLNLKFARARLYVVNLFKSTWAKKLVRILEPTIIMTIMAVMSVYLPSAFPCTPFQCVSSVRNNSYFGPLCESGSQYKIRTEDEVIRYQCPEGTVINMSSTKVYNNNSYNQVATLITQQGEEAIHRLFSRQTYYQFDYVPLLVVLGPYFILACWSAGTAVASGLVVPMLFIGALYGRIIGLSLVSLFGVHQSGYWAWMDPGAFALVGAASFFGGVSRLTMSLTVIMMEITNDVQFLLVIMTSILVAKHFRIVCLELIVFIDMMTSPNHEFYTIGDIMTRDPQCLQERTSVRDLAKLLVNNDHHAGYPVVTKSKRHDEQIFLGLITEQELYGLFSTSKDIFIGPDDDGSKTPTASYDVLRDVKYSDDLAIDIKRYASEEEYDQKFVDLRPYINKSSFSIPVSFSLRRCYILFRTMGLRHLAVVDEDNRCVGIVTRKDLMGFHIDEKIRAKEEQKEEEELTPISTAAF
ncbi:uncharacterized protein TRIADDRAFT_54760 [Trichoplax adhaerens]|uniref:Chloride channel protein n=1 Tax=Trichoplax adhaerens TaxID=10228 RepID=B3RSX3_TRIAD|nr:hypothetical protein TRIADDRAFT_54760 [Trichoplax adhaerens]EDV26598.1 hypothetical protein TRIADDRAFT_54760 [Trichoplax adhaerens]|eukprot:XP_002110594.1 hypothetical protein TRIADDRAFT_54760 [Trichoplax adhaerens]